MGFTFNLRPNPFLLSRPASSKKASNYRPSLLRCFYFAAFQPVRHDREIHIKQPGKCFIPQNLVDHYSVPIFHDIFYNRKLLLLRS